MDSKNSFKLHLNNDLNKLSQDHTDSPRITRRPSDRKLQLITIDEHGEVTIDYDSGIRIEDLLFDEKKSTQFIKDFETTKPETIKFLSQPQQLKEIIDCVLEDVERYLSPKPQPVAIQRPLLRYTRSRDRITLRKEGSFDNLLSVSPTRVSIMSRESLQSLTLANTPANPLSLSAEDLPIDKKKKKRHNSHDETLSSDERKKKRKDFTSTIEDIKKKRSSDKKRRSSDKSKHRRSASGTFLESHEENNNNASHAGTAPLGEETETAIDTTSAAEVKLSVISEDSLGSSGEVKPTTNGDDKTTPAVNIIEPQDSSEAKSEARPPTLSPSHSSPAILEAEPGEKAAQASTPRLPLDELEEMPGTHNKDKDGLNGEEDAQGAKKTPVVDVSLFKDEGYRRQSLINFGSWVLTTPTLVIEALIDNEECLDALLNGLNNLEENMFDTTPTKGREWFKVMHFLFCKYEKGPKLVEYLASPEHASKNKNIAFGLVNKIANGNVYRIFWEMIIGETLVNWSVRLEEDPFRLSEIILDKIQSICSSEYTFKKDLELMNITDLVTQVIKRNAQSTMALKFQSAQFIKPIIELSFANPPSPVINYCISIISVILELSVNNDRYNSRRFPAAISTFLESESKPIEKLKQLIALDTKLRHKPSSRQRSVVQTDPIDFSQYWGHNLIDSPFVSIKAVSIKALEVLNALLLSNFESVHKQLDADHIFDQAFNAIFEQPLNSILHHNVVNMIGNLFYCDNYEITIGFVKRSDLLDRICSELEADDKSKDRHIRAAYTHYLIQLGDKLHRVAAMITPLNDVLEAHPRWNSIFEARIAPYLEEMSKKICK